MLFLYTYVKFLYKVQTYTFTYKMSLKKFLCTWLFYGMDTCLWYLERAILSGIRVMIRFPQDDKAWCIHDISCISLRKTCSGCMMHFLGWMNTKCLTLISKSCLSEFIGNTYACSIWTWNFIYNLFIRCVFLYISELFRR